MKKLKDKTSIYVASALALILLTLGVLNGCGDNKFGDVECPSGSLQASSTDLIIGPGDETIAITGAWPGNIFITAPITFTVFDQDGITPKNNMCVVLYTNGSWFSDDTYFTFMLGTGSLNRIMKKTDNSGRVIVYWATEFIPAASATALEGTSFISAYSGAIMDTFNVKWTVASLTTTTTPPPAAPVISTTTLPAATETGAYSQTLAATGGTTPYTWTTASALPTGLTLSTAGVLSGTLAAGTAAGSPYTINVTLTDGASQIATQALTLTVNVVPTITTTSPLPVATTGVAYLTTLTATGGTTPYGLWSATALPGGLLFDTATGVINGIPTGPAGTTNIDFTITDANGVTSPVVTLSLQVL